MSNYSKLYWLTRLDNINGLLTGIAIVGIFLIVAVVLGCLISKDFDDFKDDDEVEKRNATRQRLLKACRRFWIVPLLLLLIRTFSPSRDEAIFIMAGGKTLDFVQSDTSLSKIPYQATQVISSYLDKQIQEIETEVKK